GFGGVVNVPANGADNRIALLTPPWAVRRFFARRRFDVVHFHEPYVPLLAYYAAWLTPAAAHVATFHLDPEDDGAARPPLRRRAARAVHAGLRRGIAVSRPAAAFAGRAWSGPLTVIPNGVPTDVFRPAEDGPSGGDGGPVRLLFVGSWRDERKGLRLLLEAHQRLRAAGMAVTLDVVGHGLAGPPPDLPGVTFPGAVGTEDGLAERYRACDIFVSPATGQESFGIVLLEAMASGRPIVCSDIAGYREVATPEGARFTRPGDAGELTEAIRTLVQEGAGSWRRMGEINRRAAAAYEWTSVAERVRA